jgi:DNA-3-methyladenine glycosylase
VTLPLPAMTPFARHWYQRPVLEVAPELLGAFVTTRSRDGIVTVRITEAEAYAGTDDPASHAYRGRNVRNGSMFGAPGRLYVYRHLGLHHCLNVVCEATGTPAAVLLRAGEVVEGVELARARRLANGSFASDFDLARGPGRLAVVLGLDLQADGEDVTEPSARVVVHRRRPLTVPAHSCGPRVGVSGAGSDPQRFPWRWWLLDDPTVSAHRAPARAVGARTKP